MDNSWLDEITEYEMPNEEMRIIASLCGVKTAVKLMKNLPGVMIYVPSKSFKNLRNRYICKNYNGTKQSLFDLCRMFRLTQQQIYSIIKKEIQKKNNRKAD